MEGMEESRSFGKLKSLAQRPEPKHVHLDPCGPSFTHLDHSQPPSNSPLGSRRRRTMWGLIAKCTPIIESALVLLMLCGGWGSVNRYGTLYCRLHSFRSLKCQATHIQHPEGWVSSWLLIDTPRVRAPCQNSRLCCCPSGSFGLSYSPLCVLEPPVTVSIISNKH